ncbi:hypothetical protein HRED_05578 [Candidatus Haloredivivus sp. G17]|nr:hypothetical protein HRED_05578 [Candidatus Haloredivivus sp. G17]
MLAVEDERSDVEVLTDYFTELYKSEDGLERPARNLLANFYKHQGMDSEELDINNLSEAIQSNSEAYDWNLFREEFQIFLEKRLDRYHNGSIENPTKKQNDLEMKTHYSLNYRETEFGDLDSNDPEEVFMTSVIQFQDTKSEDEEYAVEVEYLDTDEGLEAIEYLLERGKAEKVEKMITRAVNRKDNERALKAYDLLAEKAPLVADRIIEEVDEPDLKASMDAKIFENSKESFRDFRDQLDF